MSGSPKTPSHLPNRIVLRAQSYEEKDAKIADLRSTLELLPGECNAPYNLAQVLKGDGEEKDVEIQRLQGEIRWRNEHLRAAPCTQQHILKKFKGCCGDLEGRVQDHLESLNPLLKVQERSDDERAEHPSLHR